MRVSRIATLAVFGSLAVALAGCSTGGAGPRVTVTPGGSPTSTPSLSATSGPVGPAHIYTDGDQWTMTGADGALGSGCDPGSGVLPDGVWFGFAKSWSTSTIAFDMACHYVGAKADEVAAARGEEAYDFYITNDNTTVRVVTFAPTAFGHKAATDDGVFPLADIIADPGGSEPTSAPYPVWIFVNGGVVTEVTVQFLP